MRNKIRKFTEAIEANKFQEVIDEVKSMIEKTIEESGGELNSFMESYLKTPEDVKIEGLINDSDVYEFYLKYRNQIDECLKDIKYYDQTANDVGAFGLYEYVIKGTLAAIKEFVGSMLNKE
jgi:hypothetical protein